MKGQSYDATKGNWIAFIRSGLKGSQPRTWRDRLRHWWQRINGTAPNPLDPVCGDPAATRKPWPRCSRCNVIYEPRPTSIQPVRVKHDQLCRGCRKQVDEKKIERKGMRMVG